MGFSWDLAGPRLDICDRLDGLSYDDAMGDELRDLVSSYIKTAMDPGPGLQYRVTAEGYSEGATIQLDLHVSVEPAGEETERNHQLAEESSAADSLMVG